MEKRHVAGKSIHRKFKNKLCVQNFETEHSLAKITLARLFCSPIAYSDAVLCTTRIYIRVIPAGNRVHRVLVGYAISKCCEIDFLLNPLPCILRNTSFALD